MKVSNWSGLCSGYSTCWGTANGWNWEKCVQDDYIQYTLNGSYPGGIHHSTNGMWTNLAPWVPNKYIGIQMWGHYDDSCDSQWDSTIHNYC